MTAPHGYFGSPITNFENGCQLDLRVKLAIEFMKSDGALAVPSAVAERPDTFARYSLDLFTELLAQASRHGFVKPLPDTDEVPAALQRHIRQSVRASIYQQTIGQKIVAEDGNRVVPASAIPAGRPS